MNTSPCLRAILQLLLLSSWRISTCASFTYNNHNSNRCRNNPCQSLSNKSSKRAGQQLLSNSLLQLLHQQGRSELKHKNISVQARSLALSQSSSSSNSESFHDDEDNNNDDSINRQMNDIVSRTASLRSQQELKQQPRRHRWLRSIRKALLSSSVGALLWFQGGRGHGPDPAMAKFSYELQEQQTFSIRPGMSKDQAESLTNGDSDTIDEMKNNAAMEKDTPSTLTSPSPPPTKTAPTKQKATRVDYGDEDDDDYDFDDEEENFKVGTTLTTSSSDQAGRQLDQTLADRLQSQGRSNFASYSAGNDKRNWKLTIQVGACFFVPTYGFMIAREYVRRRREEAYVQKGLEILEAQKAEYFNVTSTQPDSDVEDELRKLKNNETSTDDDDEDDDDDDEDDDDDDDEDDDDEPQSRRRLPRKPPGGGGGDDSGGSNNGGGEGDLGYGRPNDDDVDRLKNLFSKS